MSALATAIRVYRLPAVRKMLPARSCRCRPGGPSCSERGAQIAEAGGNLQAVKVAIGAAGMISLCLMLMGTSNCNAASAGGGDPGHTGTPGLRHFARLVMEDLGAPAHGPSSSANIDSFAAWANLEGTGASWNPLATTQPEPGSTDFNSQGPVQNYADEGTGVKATADTIAGYSDLAAAFRSGAGVCGGAYADSFHAWSAGPAAPMSEGYTEVC